MRTPLHCKAMWAQTPGSRTFTFAFIHCRHAALFAARGSSESAAAVFGVRVSQRQRPRMSSAASAALLGLKHVLIGNKRNNGC
jgi:hypothetical protein